MMHVNEKRTFNPRLNQSVALVVAKVGCFSRTTLTMTFRTFLKEKVEEVPEKKRAKEELREGRFRWD